MANRPNNSGEGWRVIYREFLEQASSLQPKRITLGIYRQMGFGLKNFSEKWGLRPMSWRPSGKLVKDMGSHPQLPRPGRAEIYSSIRQRIQEVWPPNKIPELALCKEVHEVRLSSGIPSSHCNCE